MTKVKGPNGLVVDLPQNTAAGLIDAGHVVEVREDGVESALDAVRTIDPSRVHADLTGIGTSQVHPDLTGDGTAPVNRDLTEGAPATGDPTVTTTTGTDTGATDPTTGDPDGGTHQEKPEPPAGNASKETWTAYALAVGFTEEQLEGLSRDEIRDFVSHQ